MIKPLAYLKEWEVDGEKRCRVDLHSDCEPWLRAYGPRITSLYARSDALEPGAVAESVASQVWAALDDLYALVRKQDMEPAFRGRIERALSVARWAPRGAEPAAREASKILTEYCPKCSAQMSNWSGKLTKCVKCLHEWYMDSTAAKSGVGRDAEARWLLNHSITRETRHEWTNRRDAWLGRPLTYPDHESAGAQFCIHCGESHAAPPCEDPIKSSSGETFPRVTVASIPIVVMDGSEQPPGELTFSNSKGDVVKIIGLGAKSGEQP